MRCGYKYAAVGSTRENCNRRCLALVTNYERGAEAPGKIPNRTKTIKRNLFAIAAAGAIALGGFAVAQPQDGPGGKGGWHRHGNPLEHMTETLKLTSDQQTKVQPILDQAKPQIVAIHQEAMQKMHTVMNSTLSQIRPLLNTDQQSKLDAIEKAHQDMLNAKKQLHDAMQD